MDTVHVTELHDGKFVQAVVYDQNTELAKLIIEEIKRRHPEMSSLDKDFARFSIQLTATTF